MALGAPRFGFSGVAVEVGEGKGVSVGDGVSVGSGVGEDFFFPFAEGDAAGDEDCDFFFAEGFGDGDADSFFVADDFFFLWGVGVGVEKIFSTFSATVSCAQCAGGAAKRAIERKINATPRVISASIVSSYHRCHPERMPGTSHLMIDHTSLGRCDKP